MSKLPVDPVGKSARRWLRRIVVLGCALVAILVLSLALPLRTWRTGEPPGSSQLALEPGRLPGGMPERVWIDTDAACGHSSTTDPDDCLAILLAARLPGVEIVGLSTTFGNASIAVTDATTRELRTVLRRDGLSVGPVHRGARSPIDPERAAVRKPSPAAAALRAALAQGPLTIVALGPLTNVAEALRGRPELQARTRAIVAVMGRRRGHLFHPVEGGEAPSYLGHGPVFRDFNFAQDELAVEQVRAMRIPQVLIPYEAAREIVLDEAELAAMRAAGGAAAWVAKRSLPWLGYWQRDIGIDGFYPFDLLAVAFLVDPARFRCAEVATVITEDAGLFGLFGLRGLFVADRAGRLRGVDGATYCADVGPGLVSEVFARVMAPLPRQRYDSSSRPGWVTRCVARPRIRDHEDGTQCGYLPSLEPAP